VDYLTATKILKDVLNKPDKNNNIPKFLTTFGYAETDALDWVEYVPGSGTVNPPSREYSGRLVKMTLSNASFKRAAFQCAIPHTAGAMQAKIVDAEGRLIRTISHALDETIFIWDGKSDGGAIVSAGTYFVTITAGTIERCGTIVAGH
jgi:hypothetical protein